MAKTTGITGSIVACWPHAVYSWAIWTMTQRRSSKPKKNFLFWTHKIPSISVSSLMCSTENGAKSYLRYHFHRPKFPQQRTSDFSTSYTSLTRAPRSASSLDPPPCFFSCKCSYEFLRVCYATLI